MIELKDWVVAETEPSEVDRQYAENMVRGFFEVLENFNFHKVREIMRLTDWTWRFNDDQPTIKEMKSKCKNLFGDALSSFMKDRTLTITRGGGFEIIVDNMVVEIRFIAEEYTWIDDEKEDF